MLQKTLFLCVLAITFLVGYTVNPKAQDGEELTVNKMTMEKTQATTGQIIQIIKLKSNLSEEELLKKAHEREPQFKAIPGIIQKYYVKLGEGEYAGVYVWDSVESLKEFKASALAASIPKAYEVTEAPSIEIGNLLFQLRD